MSINVVLSVCMSVRMENAAQTALIFTSLLECFRKSVAKIEIPLKSDKNNQYST